MSQKYTNGAFVFYRVGAQCQPMTPHEIERLAAARKGCRSLLH